MNTRNILNSDNILEDLNKYEDVIFKEIPELQYEKNFDQKHPHHHLDLWNHTKCALSLSPNDEIIRISLLLHDIGKPVSFTEENGVRHYKNHAKVSAILSSEILKRLNYNEKEIELITFLIKNHDTKITKENIKENFKLYYILSWVQYCDGLSHNPVYLDKRIKYLKEIKELLTKEKNLNDDFMLLIDINNSLDELYNIKHKLLYKNKN